MVTALDVLRNSLGPNDNLVLYYAGHGYLDQEADRGYWLPIDAERQNRANWLSNADVTDALKAMRAKHVLVVADSCYAGTLTRDVAIRPSEGADLARLAQKWARSVLASGGLEPVLDRGGSGHSIFAGAFLEALRGNARAADTTTLFSTVRRRVMLGAEQTPQYADIRIAGHDGGDFIFVRPGAQLAVAPPSAPPRFQGREEVRQEFGTIGISARGSRASTCGSTTRRCGRRAPARRTWPRTFPRERIGSWRARTATKSGPRKWSLPRTSVPMW
jgi:uncharacterized caspase-like protein